jgi:ubiquinone/menaquinone biosynthesis C-methylase UbiE
VEFILTDADRLAFADSSFDASLADRTFQHLADPHRALAEMVRIARLGPRLVTVDPEHDTLADADCLVSSLRAAGEAGRFLSAVTRFITGGRKP